MKAIKTNLANRSNYGASRSTSNIKYLVIHYTANDGDSDENNGKYFHNNVVGSSAHYFVDDDSITQSVPDNYVAWHCGAKTYKHSTCRNANSIGIELCDNTKNGTVKAGDKTVVNTLELVEYLMNKYTIPKENVIRHYDVTGKLCPAYWCGTTAKNALWKSEFWNKIGSSATASTTSTATSTSYRVKITASTLNIRKGASTAYSVVGVVKKGEVYTIVGEQNGWGKLKSGAGWIKLSYTVKC